MTRPTENPTTINLLEIPEEGRTYNYSNESAELTPFVRDLLGKHPYEIEIQLCPIGNAYEVRGKIFTSLDLNCSRCAVDFKYSVNESINELLVVEDTRPRNGKSARVNHASELIDSGPFCNYLPNPEFQVGPFVHELIASAEPARPLGRPICSEPNPPCEDYQKAVLEGWIKVEGVETPNNPFSALKGIKV